MTIVLLRIFFLTLPFQFALRPLEGIDLHLSRVFAIVLFVVWVAEGLWRRKFALPSGGIIVSFLAFLSVACLSFLWAADPALSLRRAAFLLPYSGLLVVCTSVIATSGKNAAYRLAEPFVWGGFAAAAVAIGQFGLSAIIGIEPSLHFWLSTVYPVFLGPAFASAVASYPSLLVDIGGVTMHRSTGLFPDPHILAFYMGIAGPIAIVLSFSNRSTIRKRAYALAGVAMIAADFLAFSRGGYAGLAVGALAALLVFRREILLSKRRLAAAAMAVCTIAVLIAAPTPLRERLLSSFSAEEGSNVGRIASWKEGIDKLSEAPITGYGLGNYAREVKPTAAPREPIYAHDLYLDVALETGVIGAALLIAAFAVALRALVRNRDILLRAAGISLTVLLVHAIFDTPLYSVHILPAMLLLLSLSTLSGLTDDHDDTDD